MPLIVGIALAADTLCPQVMIAMKVKCTVLMFCCCCFLLLFFIIYSSQSYGYKNYKRVGIILQRGLLLMFLLVVSFESKFFFVVVVVSLLFDDANCYGIVLI